MEKLYKKKKGVAAVYLAISMVVLLLFSALVIDIGMLALNKSKIQNACDAAALAGAQELPNKITAESVARKYAIDNGVENIYIHVEFPSSNKIIVRADNKPVEFFFAKVIGINDGLASAKATALLAPVTSGIKGLRPFGLFKTEFVFGQPYTLKESSQNGDQGNFKWLSMPNDSVNGNGKPLLDANVESGSTKSYSVGNSVDSETGNTVAALNSVKALYDSCPHSPKCTSTSYVADCPRIITIPILEPTAVSPTGNTTYIISGFARFILNDVPNINGKTQATGTFIQEVITGGISEIQPDYKLNGVKLSD